MTTINEVMRLAQTLASWFVVYGDAPDHPAIIEASATLRTAVEALVSERDALRTEPEPAAPAAKYSDLVSDGGMDPRNAAPAEPAPGWCKHCRQYTIAEPLGAAPSVAPEPVAWTLQSELDAAQTTCSAHLWFTNPCNSAWTALFTREQIAAHPPRAPLTDAEIAAIVLRTVYEGDASIPHRDAWTADFGVPFARAIEAAIWEKLK